MLSGEKKEICEYFQKTNQRIRRDPRPRVSPIFAVRTRTPREGCPYGKYTKKGDPFGSPSCLGVIGDQGYSLTGVLEKAQSSRPKEGPKGTSVRLEQP